MLQLVRQQVFDMRMWILRAHPSHIHAMIRSSIYVPPPPSPPPPRAHQNPFRWWKYHFLCDFCGTLLHSLQ